MSLGFAPLEMQDAVLASQRAARLALQQAQQQFGPPPRPVGDTNYAQADIPSNAQHYITAQQVANLLTKWANYAPYLSPNVAVPLARAQVDPSSPLGQSVVRTHYGMMNPMHSAVQQVDGPMQMGGSGIPQEYQGFSSGTEVPQEYQGFASPGFPDASLQDVLGATQPQQAGLLGDIGGALSSAAHGVESGIKAGLHAGAQGAHFLINQISQADQQATANRGALGIPNAEPDVKQAVRTGMAAMQAPYEAMQNLGAQGQIAGGPLINPTGYTPPADQNPLDTLKATTLYQMIQGANSGKGLLPQGDAVTRAQALQREVRGTIDGHAVTPGRLLASEVVEPGTKPYNIMSGLVDAGVTWNADPTAIGLKAYSEARAAQKTFTLADQLSHSVTFDKVLSEPGALAALAAERSPQSIEQMTGWAPELAERVARASSPEAVKAEIGLTRASDALTSWQKYHRYGMVDSGIRMYVDPERAAAALDSKVGQSTLQALANETSVRKIKAATSWPWEVAAQVRDARTIDDVKAVLAPHIGLDVTKVPGPGFGWSSPLANSRWAQLVPGRVMDSNDPEQRTTQFERWLVNGKVNGPVVDQLVHDMAAAPDRTTVLKVAERGADHVAQVLTDRYHVEPNLAKGMTRLYRDESEAARVLHLSAVNDIPEIAGLSVDGAPAQMTGPVFPSEFLNQGVPLPNAYDIRKATTAWRGTLNHPLVQNIPVLGPAAHGLMTGTDVIAQALGGATSLWRVGVHARLALTSRILMTSQARMGAAGLDTFLTHPIDYIAHAIGMKGDAYGVDFKNIINASPDVDQFFRAMGPGYRASQGLDMVDRARLSQYVNYPRGSSEYNRAWADELSYFSREPTMHAVAQATQAGTGLDALKEAYWASNDRKLMVEAGGWRSLLATREGSDKYIDELSRILESKTGGQADLLDAVVSGNFGKKYGASRGFVKSLDTYAAQGIGPDLARGLDTRAIVHDGGQITKLGQLTDRAANAMFRGLITKPTATLSRSETFNEYYWREMGRLYPGMDEEARNAIANTLADSVGGGVPKPGTQFIPDKLRGAFTGGAPGPIAFDHADMLAKTYALNETNRLLYNFSDHNQTAEAWKIVAPFGEIWKKEVLGWAKLTAEHPQVVRRGQQIVEGARGAGFFYKDPNDGQEYFTIAPAGVTQAITGLPFPIRAQVKGLNIIGQGLPGVGPAVQIPAAHLIPQTPAFDKLRQLVLPYGDPGAAEDLTNVMFPRWVDRLKESGWLYDHTGLFKPSPTQARVFGDTVKETMAYLESTGAYDMSNPESLAKLVADAKNKAQGLYLLRAGAQFVSPSAPSVAPQVKGQDGKMYEFFVMANDFRNMEQKDYKTAVPGFIAKYGQRAFLAMQPLNQRNVYGVPTTQDAQYFIAKHGGFASAFPDTYGYFVPQGGPSDPSAYQAAIDRGEINVSTPRDWLALANQRVAASIYATQRAKFSSNLTQPQSDWLAELKTKLGHDFQGYYPDQSTSGSTLSLADQIQQLDSASKSKDVQGAAVTGPVRDYLAVRDEVYAQLHQAFGASATLNRKDATNAKAWLLSVGADIANRHPEFQPVWDQLLSREVG